MVLLIPNILVLVTQYFHVLVIHSVVVTSNVQPCQDVLVTLNVHVTNNVLQYLDVHVIHSVVVISNVQQCLDVLVTQYFHVLVILNAHVIKSALV